MKLQKHKLITFSLFAAFALHSNVYAEDSQKEDSLALEKMNVVSSSDTQSTNSYTVDTMNTATRLDISLRETPQSISVITAQQIEDMGLEDLNDVVTSVTGLSSSTNDSERQSYSARGFDIQNYQIDGVPTEFSVQWTSGEAHQDLTIYDRIEVVRGATGLVSGSGDPSAAINLVRKHANSKEFKGKASAQTGSWNKYKGEIDVSTPLNADGSIRGRVAASYEDKESYLDLYSREKSVFYGVVDADITDNTLFSLGMSYQKTEPKGVTWGGLPGYFSDGSRTDWDRSKTTAADWSEYSFIHKNYFANITHYFQNDIKLYGAYSRTDSSSASKLLYLYGSPDKTTGLGMSGGAGKYDVERKQDNIDIYASIPFETSGLQHEILTGLMYNNQNFNAYSYGYIAGSVGNFYTWNGNYPEPTWSSKSLSASSETTQTGAYIVGNFSLMDQLKLIIGSRLTNWERDTYNATTTNYYTMKHNSILTPYAGLVYNINDDYSAYISYSDIFKPQDAQNSSGDYLDPIEGANYEVGIKGEFFDDRMNASLAVFKIEQDNLAQTDPSGALVPGTTTFASVAAEGTTSKGFELETSGEITDNWNLSLGYSQFKATDASGTDVNTNFPRKTLKLFTKYKIDKFSFGGGINWQNALKDTSGTKLQDAYSLVNVMAKYDFTKQLALQLNVKNLFDKKYYANTNFYGLAYGEPRNGTLTLSYSF